MTITTKFSPDDSGLVMYKGKLVKVKISSIYTNMNGKSTSIRYIVQIPKDIANYNEEFKSFEEDTIFRSKEELIASL